MRNLTVDLDSYWICLCDAITPHGLSYNVMPQNAQTANEFASYITRDAARNFVFIRQTNSNFFKTYVSGLDINLDYDIPVSAYDTFDLQGSYAGCATSTSLST